MTHKFAGVPYRTKRSFFAGRCVGGLFNKNKHYKNKKHYSKCYKFVFNDFCTVVLEEGLQRKRGTIAIKQWQLIAIESAIETELIMFADIDTGCADNKLNNDLNQSYLNDFLRSRRTLKTV